MSVVTFATMKLLVIILRSPFYALYALWRMMAGLAGLPRGLQDARRLLADNLSCASCLHPNSLSGRWSCTSCGAVYHGFVGECAICGAGAVFFPCERCGVSIRLRSWP